MCSPTLAMMAISTAFSAISSIQQGKQQKALYEQQARINEQQARDAIARGKTEEDAQRRKVARIKGTQRATLGSQLVELDSGSASDIQADTAMFGELDALTIRNNAQREAYGYRSQAGLNQFKGAQAKQQGYMNAAGSLLDFGAGVVNSKWYDSKSALTQSSTFGVDAPGFETTGRSPNWNLV